MCRRTRRDVTFASDVVDAKAAVNEALAVICDDGTEWTFLEAQGTFNTVAAQAAYTYTAIATGLGGGITINTVLALRQTTGPPLYGVDYTDFERIRGLNTVLTGAPETWTKTGDTQVILYPTPTAIAAITAFVQIAPPALAADGDIPILPAAWHRRMLIPYACWRLLQEESGDAIFEAQSLWSEFESDQQAFRQAYGSQAEPYPNPNFVQLPTGLRGAAGSFLELAQRACYKSGLRPWVDYELLRAKEAVNETLLQVCASGDQWAFLEREGQFTLTAGGDTYLLSDIATAISVAALGGVAEVLWMVNDTNGSQPLQSMPWQELEHLTTSTQNVGDATGSPGYWSRWNDRLRLAPKPDIAYTLGVFVRIRPIEMTADTDVPLLPLEYRRPVLVNGAACKLLSQPNPRLPDPVRASLYRDAEGAYQRALVAMRADLAASREPTLMAVGASYPYVFEDPYWSDW